MRRLKRSSKIVLSTFLLLLCAWIATPKVYLHAMMGHTHAPTISTSDAQINPQEEDCDFDKYDKPAYFSLFRFISGFLPVKPKKEVSQVRPVKVAMPDVVAVDPMRGPPGA